MVPAGGSPTTTATVQPTTTTPTVQVVEPTVIRGLSVTVPVGWQVMEDNPVNFDLTPPGRPNQIAFIWLNMRAVKSTGAGHGATVLTDVGGTPSALVRWLTTNHDFQVLAAPARASISHIRMTALTIGVSRTANYGDSSCPANPHCADLFTNPKYSGPNDWFRIGGHEVVRLYLGHISLGTVIVGLDANNPAALRQLETFAAPFLNSVHLPA